MRRSVPLVLVGCALLSAPGASARFGVSKTRIVRLDKIAVREH
jgi:hypothetical protein